MTTIPPDEPVPPDAATMVPGPRGTVLRALPMCLLGLCGTPVLAWLAPRDGREMLWPTLILVAVLGTMLGLALLDHRRMPSAPTGVDAVRWQSALASARTHRALPERDDVRLAAARAAYDRVWNALMLWSFLAGFGCAAFVRPDLSWLPPLGGLAVIALTASAPVPTAWTYLRVNAAAPRRPPA